MVHDTHTRRRSQTFTAVSTHTKGVHGPGHAQVGRGRAGTRNSPGHTGGPVPNINEWTRLSQNV